MGWKDGKRPEQYLFTITDDFADDWKALKLSAKRDSRNISDVLRDAVTSKIKQPRTKSTRLLSQPSVLVWGRIKPCCSP